MSSDMSKYPNLIQNTDRTSEEIKACCSKAGKASGEAKRRRKTLSEELLAMLANKDVQEKLSVAIIDKAIDGDVRAFEVIRDTIGEKPVDKSKTEISGGNIEININRNAK